MEKPLLSPRNMEEGLDRVAKSFSENQEEDEEAENALWRTWDAANGPDSFGHLELAQDGGFSEVEELYTHSRLLTVGMLVVFVIYNVWSVIVLDWEFMQNPEEAAVKLDTSIKDLDLFYLSSFIYKNLAWLFGYEGAWSPLRVLGLLEFSYLAWLLIHLVSRSIRIFLHDGFSRWHMVIGVFWDILPELSSYSAMKLLYHVVPTIAAAQMFELIHKINEARQDESVSVLFAYWKAVKWFAILVFSFVVGFDTFLMKLRIVSAVAETPHLTLFRLLPIFQFFVQVIGVIQIGSYTKERLFKFIFGGEDGILVSSELANMHVWNSMLAREIYRKYSPWKFLVVMMSFSDYDFQKLVLNENEVAKKKIETGKQCAAERFSLPYNLRKSGMTAVWFERQQECEKPPELREALSLPDRKKASIKDIVRLTRSASTINERIKAAKSIKRLSLGGSIGSADDSCRSIRSRKESKESISFSPLVDVENGMEGLKYTFEDMARRVAAIESLRSN